MKISLSDLKGICLVEIGGATCAGCHQLMPAARCTAEKFGLNFYYADADENEELVKELGVSAVPALYLMDDGQPFAEARGYQPQEILEVWIEYKLQEHKNDR